MELSAVGITCRKKAKLRFSNNGATKIVATAQILGSYSTSSGTWMWSWANNTVDAAVKKEMDKVKEFGETRKYKELFEPKFACDEEHAWTLTSVAGEVLNAKGAYRGQIQDGWVYFLITDIEQVGK